MDYKLETELNSSHSFHKIELALPLLTRFNKCRNSPLAYRRIGEARYRHTCYHIQRAKTFVCVMIEPSETIIFA